MKIKLLAFFMLMSCFVASAQISDLSELASGKIQLFSPVLEVNDDLYGYFALYKLEKINKNEERFEYVILDKNLNKVANGEFIDVAYKNVFSKYFAPEKVGNTLILSKQFYVLYNSLYTLHRSIDLNENTISDSFYVDNEEFKKGHRIVEKNLIRDLRKYPVYEFPLAMEDGFLLYEIERTLLNKDRKVLRSLRAYNIDQTEKWITTYNTTDDKITSRIHLIEKDAILATFLNSKSKEMVLTHLDAKTGKEKYKYAFENSQSKYSHSFSIKKLENTVVIVGKYSAYSKSGYDYKKALGLFKIVLDASGNEISKKYFTWADAGKFLKMDHLGRLEERYRLHAKSYFVFNNGKISVLTEKLKEGYSLLMGANVKTEDFVLLTFDENFDLTEVETLEKDKSKWYTSDYLFSQYINDGDGVVFFYRDLKKDEETRKKNWILGIVSIVDGKLNHEKIPMSSEEHFIYPYIAKEGYILLREFNKDVDYNQVRLERLNY